MRTYISEPGFYAFLRSSDLSLALGLIGAAEHRLRLSFLRELVDPKNGVFIEWDWPGDDTIGDAEDLREHDWSADGEFLTSIDQEDNLTGGLVFEGSAAEPELVLRLMTAPSSEFGAPWIFHQSDPDWFPSVPHGHLRSRKPTKLDPYRGWAFDTSRNNRVAGRESKDFIARLWNETAFRALATNALSYFTASRPTFDWYGQRGITHPRHLPRFRRPRS